MPKPPAKKPKGKPKRALKPSTASRCRFCRERGAVLDYKEIATLQRMVSAQAKILSRKRTGNCAFHQRRLQQSIKRARYMALLAYVA